MAANDRYIIGGRTGREQVTDGYIAKGLSRWGYGLQGSVVFTAHSIRQSVNQRVRKMVHFRVDRPPKNCFLKIQADSDNGGYLVCVDMDMQPAMINLT